MHFEEMQVAPGTVITGIYGHIVSELSFLGLMGANLGVDARVGRG